MRTADDAAGSAAGRIPAGLAAFVHGGELQSAGATPHPLAIAARPRSLSHVTNVVAAPSASALAR